MADENTNPTPTPDAPVTPPWFKSKKCWATIVGSAVTIGLSLFMKYCHSATAQDILVTVLPLVAMVLAYVFGQSVVDAKVYSTTVSVKAMLKK